MITKNSVLQELIIKVQEQLSDEENVLRSQEDFLEGDLAESFRIFKLHLILDFLVEECMIAKEAVKAKETK